MVFPFNPIYHNNDDLSYICKAYYSSHKMFTSLISFKHLSCSQEKKVENVFSTHFIHEGISFHGSVKISVTLAVKISFSLGRMKR